MSNHEHQTHQGAAPCCGGEKTPAAGQDKALDSLKQEILNSLEERRRAPVPWSGMMVSVILGLLALLSLTQTVQSITLYNKLKSGDLTTAAAPAPGGSSALPTQVGGC